MSTAQLMSGVAAPDFDAAIAEMKRREADPSWQTRRGRWFTYGISLDDYDEMVARQGGGCAICQQPLGDNSRKIHVDHDHGCTHAGGGTKCCRDCVRGVLCSRCNILVGWIENNRPLLPAVDAYLTMPPSERALSNDRKCAIADCANHIARERPVCYWHWGSLSTREMGAFWDGRATSADIIATVNRKVARRVHDAQPRPRQAVTHG